MLNALRKIIRESISEIHEGLISPSKDPNIMSFWHGGDLDVISDTMRFSKSRYEYGPGLYLTTNYNVVLDYSKGRRKLYMVNVAKGNEISDVKLDVSIVQEFVNTNSSRSKSKEAIPAILNWTSDGKISANIFLNIMLNESVMKPTTIHLLKDFLVQNGVDYLITGNIKGWSGDMMVLFNLSKIKSVQRVMPNDTIETYEL